MVWPPVDVRPQRVLLTSVTLRNYSPDMNQLIPSFREPTLISWDNLFSDMNFSYQAEIILHGIPFVFHSANQEIIKELKNYFPKKWQRTSKSPIHVFWRAPDETLLKGEEWENIEDPNCLFQDRFICQRDFMARKNDPFNFQLVAREMVDDGLFNFLRYLLPLHLLKQNRILFHSSCVVDEKGEAYLFFGPSNAGKTTIAGLCKEGVILGDDMNILSFQDGRVFVEGAALGQRFFNLEHFGDSFPVKQVFWLKQSDELIAQAVAEGVLGFFLSSFANLFWNQLSQQHYNQVFRFAHQLSQTLNLYELNFPKSERVWNYVREL